MRQGLRPCRGISFRVVLASLGAGFSRSPSGKATAASCLPSLRSGLALLAQAKLGRGWARATPLAKGFALCLRSGLPSSANRASKLALIARRVVPRFVTPRGLRPIPFATTSFVVMEARRFAPLLHYSLFGRYSGHGP